MNTTPDFAPPGAKLLGTVRPGSKVSPRRTKHRSRSGARAQCPHCDKLLRGEKGVKTHIKELHPEAAPIGGGAGEAASGRDGGAKEETKQ